MKPVSTHPGSVVLAFPDVCKTPAPPSGGFVPTPYPNATAYGPQKTADAKPSATPAVAPGVLTGVVSSSTKSPVAFKETHGLQLKARMHSLHQQIVTLPPGDPNRWHKLIDEYVILTAALYKTVTD